MIDVCSFHQGGVPLLVSVPHDGCHLPGEMEALMTETGKALPDTDWHVAELYAFVRELGASMLVANYSRYVVDLNRSADDEVLYPGQLVTGLCPTHTFAGDPIYEEEIKIDTARRVEQYWQPYHRQIDATLAAIHEQHGYALLWDAHSIPSEVPRLFEGQLPALNIGTNDGASCDPRIEQAVAKVAESSDYSNVVNGRFRGGYITRHYGAPDAGVHAVQLEIAQRVYMDEAATTYDAAKAAQLRATLRAMLEACLATAREELNR